MEVTRVMCFSLVCATLFFGACSQPPAVGCYQLDWTDFAPKTNVPMDIVPDGVKLESTGAGDGRMIASPRTVVVDDRASDAGVLRTWDGILYDRTWSMVGDTIDVVLKDLGYNEWHIRLTPEAEHWIGEAVYRTTIGGGVRSDTGAIKAFSCDGV